MLMQHILMKIRREIIKMAKEKNNNEMLKLVKLC